MHWVDDILKMVMIDIGKEKHMLTMKDKKIWVDNILKLLDIGKKNT